MDTSLLLVHSPLLGPSSWRAAAGVLIDRGYDVAVPDLTAVAEAPPPRWRTLVDAAHAAASDLSPPVAVVGHSGAGAFLPAIGDRLSVRGGWSVFVDAVIPPPAGAHETSAELQSLLDGQTEGDRLRPWLDWWPEEVLDQLLPDPSDRALLRGDMPRLPRAFYDEQVPVPDGWSGGRCAYLKLSTAYDDGFEEAGRRGWPVAELDADHLAVHTEPEMVAEAIVGLPTAGR